MSELMFVLVSGGISIITQLAKKHFPKINPLFVLAVFALFGGGIWGFFSKIADTEMIAYVASMWGTAIVIYNVVKQFAK